MINYLLHFICIFIGNDGTSFYFFVFQAEDGILDFHVTGVQTCALPISRVGREPTGRSRDLPPGGTTLSALRHADTFQRTGRRQPHGVLVPDLPKRSGAGGGVRESRGRARPASVPLA